jgi:hypothetical protein
MLKLRFAILGAAAALALGTAGAVAMVETASTSDSDSHGDAVSSAARTTCPHGAGGVHGECVSAVASAEAQDNDSEKSNPAATCKASDAKEDASEKPAAPASKHDQAADKAAKAAEHSEDKAEHKAFAACVSAGESGS